MGHVVFHTQVHIKSKIVNIITERLSLELLLLILRRVFSVDGMWPQLLSHLGMQIKVWLVRKHPSRLGMQLKDPVYKSCVYLCKSYHS